MCAYYQKPTDTTGHGIGHGSSTGAPGAPLSTQDVRAHYDPTTSGFNSATGSGYTKSSTTGPHEHPHLPTPSKSDNQMAGQDDRIRYAPNTVQRSALEDDSAGSSSAKDARTESRAGRMGEDVGRKAHGLGASIHGAGESLRGALTAAVDRAFGSEESAERNEEIARRGQEEMQVGEFGASTAPQRNR
ncbi:hypothetical protein N7462_006183 [Penicillium macrosclerotiorum]|uniref:uncharacterized protein n=1 Tax=Penicillium macrosclerotiorum TaxID=303699 RepID=UPI002548C048|nr:uncharacterized protein N7462_006183 [Penicillium macrosclerotiorum]KAJ5683018.1 hypothetical protein N7462_006183 [Penicillium macrosclerotiorum]